MFLLAGATGGSQGRVLQLLGAGPADVSPDGDGLNDVVHLRVRFGSAGQARIEAFAWGGRDTGWRDLARSAPVDVSRGEQIMTWAPQNKLGGSLRDGTYVITVCRTDASSAVRRVPARPGPAEVTVVNPPWARVGVVPGHVRRVRTDLPSQRTRQGSGRRQRGPV